VAKRKKSISSSSCGSCTHVGHYAFLLGVVLALLLGVFDLQGSMRGNVLLILLVLGLVVGLMNITEGEVTGFLLAALVLMVGANAFGTLSAIVPYVGAYMKEVMMYLTLFVAPAALVVALKAVYSTSKN
jgi:hypothetical protein